jgi:uncharacterized membrane protein
MKQNNWIVFTFLALAFLACNDDDDPAEGDITPPTITISTPNDGEVFTQGETIRLQARVEDDVALEEIIITLTYPNGSENSFERGTDDFSDAGRVDEIMMDFAIPETALTGEYIITIDAKDIQGNQAPPESLSVQVEEGGG